MLNQSPLPTANFQRRPRVREEAKSARDLSNSSGETPPHSRGKAAIAAMLRCALEAPPRSRGKHCTINVDEAPDI